MLGTDKVKKYFDNSAATVYPFISAEWNYNLIYYPFATFAGNGINVINDFPSTGWNVTNGGKNNITATEVQDAKLTGTFTDTKSVKFTVKASNVVDAYNFEGKVSINFPLKQSGAKCYKVVFYARSIDNNIVHLSTTLDNNTSGLHSSNGFMTLDNYTWQKVEIVAGVKPNGTEYNNFDLTLDFANTTLDAAGLWGIEVCHLQAYEISYFDYCYGSLWSTNSIFTYFRPGESYVTSGNASIPDITRTVTKANSKWNNSMPCSPVVYSPKTLFSVNSNSIYKNGNLSPFSQYKYFVSEIPNPTTSVGAIYEELLQVNKLVLKFNVSQSKPSNLLVQLYNTAKSTEVDSTINIKSADISDAGVCVLYYHPEISDASKRWNTTKWTWDAATSGSMPTINSKGQVTKSTNINKIVLTQISTDVVAAYKTNSYNKSDVNTVVQEFSRLQVVEISPRMELDLSSFVIDYSITKELDSKSTPLPISSMSANAATIALSNIPLSGDKNIPLSVFSTNANDSTVFISPLKNLLTKNVKFYMNYYIPSTSVDTQENRIIPGGVFYSDSWDNQDIKVAKVTCFDAIKFLQTVPVADYVSHKQSLINIFTNLMDFSGFTDYNYDELLSVLKDNNHYLSATYFFADSKQKTIYDILREAFLAYQIGSYIDEYGVMRFANLNQIISNNIPTYTVDDSNLVINSYNESIRAKTGKVIMRYRMPQIKRALPGTGAVNSKQTTILNQAPDIIWQQETEDVVPYNHLSESISSNSQSYYRVNPLEKADLFYSSNIEHHSYAVVEGEIISTGDQEMQFSSGSKSIFVPVTGQNDLAEAIAEFSNSVGVASISYEPTSRFRNVKRGLFGTKPSTHTVMSDKNGPGFGDKLQYWSIANDSYTITPGQNLSIENELIKCPITGPAKTFSFVTPKSELDQGYNTYSAKFKFYPKIMGDHNVGGIVFNIDNSSSINNNAFFAMISAKTNPKNLTLNNYELNYGNWNGSPSVGGVLDVTNVINAYISNQPKTDKFAQKELGMINLKVTVNSKTSKIVIYINNYRIQTDVDATSFVANKNTRFGFYCHGDNVATSQVYLSELYACESVVDETVSYHFQKKSFLNDLVADKKQLERFFFVQSQPVVIGLNMYDVQNVISPSMGAEPFKVMYNLYYSNSVLTNAPTDWISVYENNLSYSDVINSGFRSKFAIVNNSPFSIWTKTGSEYNKAVSAQFMVGTRSLIVLTEQQSLERVLNPQNVNEVVELQSDWVQSLKAANSILGVVAKASDAFSKNISVEIFGNPLVQVGDVVSLTHTLKNISGITFFVQSVSQTFNQGLKTMLVLNEIGYSPVPSKVGTAPTPQTILNSAGTVVIESVNGIPVTASNPAKGSIEGGDTVVLSGGAGFAADALPSVLFGSSAAYNVTYINSPTRIQVSSPAHDAGSVPIYITLGTSSYSTKTYAAFTYSAAAATVVGPITDLTVYSDTYNYATKKDDITLLWTQPTNSSLFDYHISGDQELWGTDVAYPAGQPYNLAIPNLTAGKIYTITVTPKSSSGALGDSMTITHKAGTATDLPGVIINATPISSTSFKINFGGVSSLYNVITKPIKSYVITLSATGKPDQTFTVTTGEKTFTNLTAIPYDILINGYPNADGTGDILCQGALYNFTPGTSTSIITYSGVSPSTPTIDLSLSDGTSTAYKNINILIDQDTSNNTPVSYEVTLSPGRSGQADEIITPKSVTQMPLANGVYTFTITNVPKRDDASYIVYVKAKNQEGTLSGAAKQGIQIPTTSKPVSIPTATGNTSVSWTGNAGYDAYHIVYQGLSAEGTNEYKIDYVASSPDWKNPLDVSISNDGINFTDSSFSWSEGGSVVITVTGQTNNVNGDSQTYTYPIPVSVVPKPFSTGPKVVAENFHRNADGSIYHASGGCYSWYNPTTPSAPTGDWVSWGWDWEIYYNKTSASGTPGNTGHKDHSSPNINTGSSSYFLVNTGSTGSSYFRVRQTVVGANGTTYYSPWGGISGKFT